MDLQSQAQLHPSLVTNFAITYTLNWSAQMLDTIDSTINVANDVVVVNVTGIWWAAGFIVKVAGG
jgi:hypothetical protein